MNSTHAAWGNWCVSLFAAVVPLLSTMPVSGQWASYSVAVATALNGILHALLPDAPK